MTDELPEEAPPESTPPQPPAHNPALPPEPPPSAPAGPKRPLPGSVTAAAIVLLVYGTIAAFGALLALLWSMSVPTFMPMVDGGFFDRMPGPGMMGGFDGRGFWWMGIASVGVMVVLGAAVAGGHIAAGWAILQRLAWGRILGMVVAGVGLVVLLVGVAGTLVWVSNFQDLDRYVDRHMMDWFRGLIASSVAFGTVLSVAVGFGYAFVLWVLGRHEEAFD